MAQFDLELVRKAARLTALSFTRFDPVFCGKVVRVTAAVSVIEFLLMAAVVMLWLPADSSCQAEQSLLVYAMLALSAVPALWLCVIAVFWRHFARWTCEWESQRPRWIKPPSTALLNAVFVIFAAAVLNPFVVIFQTCGS